MTGRPEDAARQAGHAQQSRALAYANAVSVALATRQAGGACAGCGNDRCRCLPVTPAELQAIRDALSAATVGTERPILTQADRERLVAALEDAANWRRLASYALCPACHVFPDDATTLCGHNRADQAAADAYDRLACWLAAFPGWAGQTPVAGAS